VWIDRNRLIQQFQSLENSGFCYGKEDGKRTQIEIVGGEVGLLPRGGAAHLGGLQCGLNYASNADRHLVLKLEHVFERTVESIGPEMCAGECVDQLGGNAHATTRLAH
jgi:hypothetical protein